MPIVLCHHPFSRAAGVVWMLEELGVPYELRCDRFSMADAIFGGTLRSMPRFDMPEARPAFAAYCDRLGARAALQRADARNAAVAKQHGLGV